MYTYSIVSLDTEHIDEICQDIRQQYRDGISTSALFVVKLVPEGNPPIDKAGIECAKIDLFRDKLAESGDTCGILVQCSIGHGYPLNSMFPFQKVVNLTDGKELSICCPYDEGFRSYIRSAMTILAAHHPDSIMVDDDFRLLTRSGRGCACPKHMAEFNRRAGTNLSREELLEIVRNPATEENRKLKAIYEQTQAESLEGAAMAMREGIDAVNPSLQGSFCACGDPAGNIAKILAGKGNPSILRVNNGNYTAPGARGLSTHMFRAALQANLECNRADVYLAETDTCPQNRYSTGAQSLHAHFTGSILEGMNGAKHWITRLAAYEPASGKAYRKVLGKNSGFYETLANMVPTLRWLGCRIPLPTRLEIDYNKPPYDNNYNGWATCVLERMGLPMYFSPKAGGAVFLDNGYDALFSDEEISEFFRGTVFLSSGAADSLNRRGFGKMTGVQVRDWNGRNISGELLAVNGQTCAKQMDSKELVPVRAVRVNSVAYHIPDGKRKEDLFPVSTTYCNPSGGTTHVFSGTPTAPFTYSTAFSFLNESRKLQMIRLLEETGNLPIYYPEDAEVYLKAADTPDGKLFCAFFNLGFDILEEIPLVVKQQVKQVKMLRPNGIFENVIFHMENDRCTVETPAYTLNPVILILE